MSNEKTYMTINGKKVEFTNERNVLEVVRKADIEIPTFCYHSELSIYGACRLCTVEVEGRGLMASCSIPPENGLVVNTHTKEVKRLRKVAIELTLANHDNNCTTCEKSTACKLQDIAKKLGVDEIRYKQLAEKTPKDTSSPAIVRDPAKCILCGDCVRMCDEVQGIGAIDFAHRGHDVVVTPAFDKDLDTVDCIFCGQCARVCPTGAIVVKSEIEKAWDAIFNANKTVVFQVAPAVRVALGEEFGIEAGTAVTGQMVAAIKKLGADEVYDTTFTADLTIMEEGTEFLGRLTNGGVLPQFTSCCPGWVKTAEQYYPDLLPNLSSCKSPQQMFGSVAKDVLTKEKGIEPKDLVVVSVMPCVAKKFESKRPEFAKDGVPDVDINLTTQELARMIKEKGIDFNNLKPESFDMPFGFRTGAGVLFGNSGGVTEAVLRFAYEKVSGKKLQDVEFDIVRNVEGVREANIDIEGTVVKLAIVHGLRNAKNLAEKVRNGEADYHIIEVMACPGGCIGGAGQPVSFDDDIREKRTQGIYTCDKMLQLHKSQDNPYIEELYKNNLGEVGGHKAHDLLHTKYNFRKRLDAKGFLFNEGTCENKVEVKVCVGTNCYLKGSQDVLHQVLEYVKENGIEERVDVRATFCIEECGKAPNAMVGEDVISACSFEAIKDALDKALKA
jgi:NADH-quinone oxidoreductase subunit G